MKTKTHKISFLLTMFILFSAVLPSCEDDEKSGFTNDPAKKEKVEKVLAFRQELDFINRFVEENVVDLSSDEGRKSSFSSAVRSRLAEVAPCADATEEEFPDGSIKISMDFGSGCTTDEGIEVAGKVVMIFSFLENTFEYSLEFTNYSEIGTSSEHFGEVVNGTITGNFILDFEHGTVTQEMEQDLTITYENNTQATYFIAQKAELTETGLRVVELETSGNFADGGEFTMTLSKALVYDFSCEGDYPVKGEEVLMFQGNTIKVNYGDGTCDSSYAVK